MAGSITPRAEVLARVVRALRAIEAGDATPDNPYPPMTDAAVLWDELLQHALVAGITPGSCAAEAAASLSSPDLEACR